MKIFDYRTRNSKAVESNMDNAENYKDAMIQEGAQNKKTNSAMAIVALANAGHNMQKTEGAINMANESFDKQMEQQNADLAAMGYSPSTNSVYMDANSTLASDRANTIANIENEVAEENFNTMTQGISSATNLYNQGFKNLTGNYTNALKALFSANQSQLNKSNNNMNHLTKLAEVVLPKKGGR